MNLQPRVVAQLERDDGADAGGADRVADGDQLVDVQPGRLLEQDVLAGLGGGDGLRRVQVVRRGDVDDVDVVGLEQVLEARRDAGVAGRLAVLRQRGVDAIDVAADQRDDLGVGVLVERGDVLRGAPADPDDADSEPCSHRAHTSGNLASPSSHADLP